MSLYGTGKIFQHKDNPRVFSKLDGAFYTLSDDRKNLVPYLDFNFGKHELGLSSLKQSRDISYYHKFSMLDHSHVRFMGIANETDKSVISTMVYRGHTNFHTIIYNKDDSSTIILRRTRENVNFLPCLIDKGNAFYLIEDANMYEQLVPEDMLSKNFMEENKNYMIVYRNIKI